MKIFSVLLFLGVTCAGVLFWNLNRDAYLRGADAYYYALQADYWAKTGEVKIPDSSPVHRIAGQLQKMGMSMEGAQRLWTVLSLALLATAAALLIVASRRSGHWLQALLFFCLLFSPSILFTAIEFPKMFSWVLLVPLWFLPLCGGGKTWLWAIPVSLATVLLHRAALPLALLFSGALLLLHWQVAWKTWWRRILPVTVVLALLGLGYIYFFPDRFRFDDLSRLSWQNLEPGYLTLLGRANLPIAIKAELLLAPLLYFGVALIFWRTPGVSRREIVLPLSLVVPALFPFGADEVFGVGERYAILLPLGLFVGSLFLSTRLQPVTSRNWKLIGAIGAASLAAIVATPQRLNAFHPLRLDPDFAAFDRVTSTLKAEDIPMLIAQRGLVFFYKAKLTREAFPYEPEDHWNKTRVWRVVYQIEPEAFSYYLEGRCQWGNGLIKSLPDFDYVLLREDCWQAMRQKITSQENTDLYQKVWRTYLNPSEKRPAFLYAKHRGDSAEEFSALP